MQNCGVARSPSSSGRHCAVRLGAAELTVLRGFAYTRKACSVSQVETKFELWALEAVTSMGEMGMLFKSSSQQLRNDSKSALTEYRQNPLD
jgi:hypothetical protein